MAVIVCHGLKGGAGTTFVSAHVAMRLAEAGADVTILTIAERDTIPLHFGLQPASTVPSLFAPAEDALIAGGINLRSYNRAAEDPDFMPMLQDLGFLKQNLERTMVIDVPASAFAFANRITPYVSAHLSVLNAAPDTLALLPRVLDEAGAEGLTRTSFVINALDETRRLARHSAAFIRELAGPRLIGRIRLDEAVPEAIATLKSLNRYAPASAALHDVRNVGAEMIPALDIAGRPWGARASQAQPKASRAA